MTEPLTFQVSATTVGSCINCPWSQYAPYAEISYCSKAYYDDALGFSLYAQNCDGLTESCPVIQERKTNDDAKQT